MDLWRVSNEPAGAGVCRDHSNHAEKTPLKKVCTSIEWKNAAPLSP